MKPGDRTWCAEQRPDARVAGLAACQHGVIEHGQAVAAGVSGTGVTRRVAAGRWVRVLPRVYRIGGAPAAARQWMMAATLWAGDGALLSHRSAGELWQLDGVGAGRFDVSSTRRLRSGIVRAPLIGGLEPVDRAVVDGIPVTSPTRTLVDLAGVLSDGRLELALEDALRRRLTSSARLARRLDELGRRGRPGVGGLHALVAVRGSAAAPSESALEVRVRRFLGQWSIPDPIAQFEVRHAGRLVARLDFAYPGSKVAIEVEGYRWHSGRQAFERDLARRSRLAALGWRVVHVTSRRLLDEPEHIAAEVRAALAA